MGRVVKDFSSSGDCTGGVNRVQGGEGVADDFSCFIYDALKF